MHEMHSAYVLYVQVLRLLHWDYKKCVFCFQRVFRILNIQ
jgi:hypothetical protein